MLISDLCRSVLMEDRVKTDSYPLNLLGSFPRHLLQPYSSSEDSSPCSLCILLCKSIIFFLNWSLSLFILVHSSSFSSNLALALSRVLFQIDRYLYSSISFESRLFMSLFIVSRQVNYFTRIRYYSSFQSRRADNFQIYCLRTSTIAGSQGWDPPRINMLWLDVSTVFYNLPQEDSCFKRSSQPAISLFSCFQRFSFSKWYRHSRQQSFLHFSTLLTFSVITLENYFWKKQFTSSSLELLSQSCSMQILILFIRQVIASL